MEYEDPPHTWILCCILAMYGLLEMAGHFVGELVENVGGGA